MFRYLHLFILMIGIANTNLSGQFYIEDFENGLPSEWTTYTQAGFDFVSDFGGEVNLFKQSDGEEVLMLISPSFDLSEVSKLEIDYYGFNLSFISSTLPELHIGYLEDPEDPQSFNSIHTVIVDNTESETLEIYLGYLQANSELVFKLQGDRSHIIYLDNFKLYNEPFQNNIPAAISDLKIEGRAADENIIDLSWVNPEFEVDGDPLMNLNTVEINFGSNTERITMPNIGSEENTELEFPSAGFYSLEIYPTNDAGEGYKVLSSTFWVGLDVPGLVQNLVLEKTNDKAILKWDAPIEGLNGAYYDGEVEAYTVLRSDGKTVTIPGDETNFEEALDIQGSVNYAVFASNKSGDGGVENSNVIYRVNEDYLYYEDFYVDIVESSFEELEYAYKWTNSGTSDAFWNHFGSNIAGGNRGEMAFLSGNNSTGNDIARIASPIINTSGFNVLALEWDFSIEYPLMPDYSLVLETSSDQGFTWQEVETYQSEMLLADQVKKIVSNSDVGSETFQFAFTIKGNTNAQNFARIDNVRLSYQPGIDIKVIDILTESRIEPGVELPIEVVIENSSTEITSALAILTLKERYGNGTLLELQQPIEDLGIGEVRSIDFESWDGIEGEYLIGIEMRNDNDDVPENNTSTKAIDVLQLMPKDLVIIEEFTGTWCAYCPGTALGIEELINEGQALAAIAYHRSDDYETPIVQPKMNLYNVQGFPTVVIDGEVNIIGGDFSQSVAANYRPTVESFAQKSVPVKVEFVESFLSDDERQYKATIDVSSLSEIANDNLSLRIAIIENHIAEEWQGLEVLDFVQRAYLQKTIDLKDRTDREIMTIDLPEEMDKDNGAIVAWVQSGETNEIMNAAQIPMTERVVANWDKTFNQHINLRPNPVNDYLTLSSDQKIGKITLYDHLGKVIHNWELNAKETKLSLSHLTSGLYFIKFGDQEQEVKSVIKL